ncbi:OmpW family outer membrane protein [Piscirickettsia salmonis]|uniref:OmpW family outer membrane protein n=1 Tax=Piscirickettsia salmonis TaxID=1238 RepID=UPI00249D9D68|nr:OmpW family outer membrane protein [Piscirickettsia salmonis]
MLTCFELYHKQSIRYITQNWPINLDVKKLFVKTTATVNLTGGGTAKTDVRLDPYVYGIGVGYRFTSSITIIRAFRI